MKDNFRKIQLTTSEHHIEFVALLHQDSTMSICMAPQPTKVERASVFKLINLQKTSTSMHVVCRLEKVGPGKFELTLKNVDRLWSTGLKVTYWPKIVTCPDPAARALNTFFGDTKITSNPGFLAYIRGIAKEMKQSIPSQAARLKDKEIK